MISMEIGEDYRLAGRKRGQKLQKKELILSALAQSNPNTPGRFRITASAPLEASSHVFHQVYSSQTMLCKNNRGFQIKERWRDPSTRSNGGCQTSHRESLRLRRTSHKPNVISTERCLFYSNSSKSNVSSHSGRERRQPRLHVESLDHQLKGFSSRQYSATSYYTVMPTLCCIQLVALRI